MPRSRSDRVAASAGIHAWMAGAAGIMTLAVMSRATLGHTGQPLTASRATQAIYAAIIVAALSRICAAIDPVHGEPLLHLAALAWAAAFFGFALVFGPLLAGSDRRGDGAEGGGVRLTTTNYSSVVWYGRRDRPSDMTTGERADHEWRQEEIPLGECLHHQG